ncbi:TPA: hypothetical protein N0F65_010179 [Lagenidium giganteum]|uniref:Tubulin-folding cofactor C n=1 Tax=Lagenidium giganteum TaxID=4803 RepID=A0AAV2Z8P5_9STRA|nr:TPA: hypothetical protein N0F65_010179 [Lagenidium giganteum]
MAMTEHDELHVGQRCEVPLGVKTGIRASIRRFGEIAFIGVVAGLPDGEWVGVRLDQPLGKNDGTYNGVRYFECAALHGVFTRREKVKVNGDFPVLATQGETVAFAIEERRKQSENERRATEQGRAQNNDKSADQLVQEFWQQFTAEEDAIRKHVETFIDQKKQPVPCSATEEVKLDDAITQVHKMRELAATAASLYLSPYDNRQSQLIISKLVDYIESTRAAFAPRKKFTFRSRQKRETQVKDSGSPEMDSSLTTPVENEAQAANKSLLENPDELRFEDKQGEVIFINHETFGTDREKRRDLSFARLVNCVICVNVETSAMRGIHLTNCIVIAGPVWGSLWLEHCHGCHFFVACRQLRVHHTDTTSFHLRINSHPIIEDCHQLRFGPYRIHYKGLDEQLEQFGMARDSGFWIKVNDFKWHRAQQSPNWSPADPKQPLPQLPAAVADIVSYE